MTVVAIRKTAGAQPVKTVEGNQKAIDLLPFASGMWKVAGESGLYVRCRARSKSFMLQRRIDGDLVKLMLGQITVKEAREEAKKQWGKLERKQPVKDVLTLGLAIENYIEAKVTLGKMAPKTVEIARYNAQRYFAGWKDRPLSEIGRNRLGLRQLGQRITREYGAATSNQCVRLLSAVYRWHRDVDDTLPEWSRKAAELHTIAARDWAFTPDELRTWWSSAAKGKDGKPIARGVNTLGPIKKMWWLVALLTGARRGSVEALRWQDLDFDKKIIKFTVAKGGRVYSAPMPDKLAELLIKYRDSGEVAPSAWCFPSSVIDGKHITAVRNQREGVAAAHHLRHSFRTTLAELGATPDQAKLLLGHSLGGVSGGYVSAPLLTESLRPWVNAVAQHYLKILNIDTVESRTGSEVGKSIIAKG